MYAHRPSRSLLAAALVLATAAGARAFQVTDFTILSPHVNPFDHHEVFYPDFNNFQLQIAGTFDASKCYQVTIKREGSGLCGSANSSGSDDAAVTATLLTADVSPNAAADFKGAGDWRISIIERTGPGCTGSSTEVVYGDDAGETPLSIIGCNQTCLLDAITLTPTPATAGCGDTVRLCASSGGSGNLKYEFDVDHDGTVDVTKIVNDITDPAPCMEGQPCCIDVTPSANVSPTVHITDLGTNVSCESDASTSITIVDDCEDGNACNGVSSCVAGACQVTTPAPDCSGLDDQCNTGVCQAPSGSCVAQPKANDTPCSDGNACTQTDTCQAGSCQGSNPVVCTALDQCHVPGTCNDDTGICSNPPKANGSSCDDGNACTQTDTCQAGSCTGMNPVVCTAQDQCHLAGVCDPANGTCSDPAKDDGSSCNDGNACTQSDTCQAGSCTGSNPVVCTAQDQCHVPGTCDPANGTCSNPNKSNGSSCDDDDACTQTDTCQAGACTGTNPVVCTALDQCHVPGVCDTDSGICSNPNKTDGSGCNDGSACSQTDTCQAGVCTGGNPVVCTALDQCHVPGSCNPANGTCSNPNKSDGSSCSDGNACTLTDTCQAGSCAGGNPKVCTPSDACHDAGVCAPATGACSNPSKPAGFCDDHSVCTTDSCNPQTGCVHQAISCNDGNACTTDSCDATAGCQHGAITCTDGSFCTHDSCDPSSGCKYVFDPDLNERCTETHACRSAGFWGTHAGNPYNLAQMAIDAAGSCVEVCGEILTNTTTSSPNSSVEAICVSPRSDPRLQLARQLTAMSLNCAMNGFGGDCSGHIRFAPLFAVCNDACTNKTGDVGDCIAAIDCFNNGGEMDLETGLCLTDTIANCHLRDMPAGFNESTAATSSQACSSARKNACTILPPGELSGCTQPGLTLDPAVESCQP
jgi:hypothetical protein